LNDNDLPNETNDKRSILYDVIITMPDDIKNIFNKKYPNMLSDITKHIFAVRTTSSNK